MNESINAVVFDYKCSRIMMRQAITFTCVEQSPSRVVQIGFSQWSTLCWNRHLKKWSGKL